MALDVYLHNVLGSLASQLGWSVEAGSYEFIVSETLDALGLSAEPNPLTKSVKVVGKAKLYETVLNELSGDYDVSGDGVNLKRSQVFDQVKLAYERSWVEALEYSDSYSIEIGYTTE